MRTRIEAKTSAIIEREGVESEYGMGPCERLAAGYRVETREQRIVQHNLAR